MPVFIPPRLVISLRNRAKYAPRKSGINRYFFIGEGLFAQENFQNRGRA
jgi:hypothetical protein